ncbi:MAG: phytanoyl-CoA dioxygenase family protein [Planctomycetes bacterium]|nr:phytanoyl-CoA dioxygenase family protein [Planctomycetota bacterium]MCB9868709.1 phytanoyl-CoA dioxygenase family protein [Planctomycetota bacterium]MCB9889909.1 phytanoyl-CoA dioxygenase family protein [Planctomycetota bacterium]
MSDPLEFPVDDLPWVDRPAAEIDRYIAERCSDVVDRELLRYQLLHWQAFGYVIVPGAVEPELIDALLGDVDEMLSDHRRYRTVVDSHRYPQKPMCEVDQATIDSHRADSAIEPIRILDFIHHSVAAKRISLHPAVTRVLEHALGDRVVAFQSLNFFYGSQQPIHQDFAYVPGRPRARLVASWVALEDIHPDSGPLVYIPGSHRLRKFDWADGPFKVPGTKRNEIEFEAHILREAERAGLQRQVFCPKKGDALLWHSALAHGGSPVADPKRTRKAYVTHYAPHRTHSVHVHATHKDADMIDYPGGLAMRHPLFPELDDVFRRAAPPVGSR